MRRGKETRKYDNVQSKNHAMIKEKILQQNTTKVCVFLFFFVLFSVVYVLLLKRQAQLFMHFVFNCCYVICDKLFHFMQRQKNLFSKVNKERNLYMPRILCGLLDISFFYFYKIFVLYFFTATTSMPTIQALQIYIAQNESMVLILFLLRDRNF